MNPGHPPAIEFRNVSISFDGAQGGYVEPVAGYVPGVQVCLLEEGRIAFFGSPQEFAQSSLPAVQHMLHPMTDVTHGELDVDDPWRQNQKTRRYADRRLNSCSLKAGPHALFQR
jgi:hypothetical protein